MKHKHIFNDKEKLSVELQKSHNRRIQTKFYDKYFQGNGLQLTFKQDKKYDPVTTTAELLEIIPDDLTHFRGELKDFIFVPNLIENVNDYDGALNSWFNNIKVGGYLILTTTHQYLYERKRDLPSKWNPSHKRFFTPGTLMRAIEYSLKPNSYRLTWLKDIDDGYKYFLPPTEHPQGCYEIECVIKKIEIPKWSLE